MTARCYACQWRSRSEAPVVCPRCGERIVMEREAVRQDIGAWVRNRSFGSAATDD